MECLQYSIHCNGYTLDSVVLNLVISGMPSILRIDRNTVEFTVLF